MQLKYLTRNNNLYYEFQNVPANKIWQQMSSYDDFKETYWHDLYDIFKVCLTQVAKLELPKYIHSKEHIQQYFLNYGFDFNHIDAGGNTFLKYYLSTKRNDEGGHYKKLLLSKNHYNIIDFFGQFMKPELIAHKNNFGETILFNLLHVTDTGLGAEYFIQLLNKYPQLSNNLHDKNNHNFNLLNKALNESNIFIIPYFLEQKLTYTHKFAYNSYHKKNKDIILDQNILDHFIFFAARDDAEALFNLFIQKVDICPNRKDSFFNTMLEWSISDKVHQETRIKSYDWLAVINENLQNKTFLKTKSNVKRMHKKVFDFAFKQSNNMNKDLSKVVLSLLFSLEQELGPDFFPNKKSSNKIKI